MQQIANGEINRKAEVTAPYIDTVELFSRYCDAATLSLLRVNGFSIKQNPYGWRLIVNTPRQDQLHLLETIQQQIKMTISRVDIAFDVQCHNASEAKQVKQWLINHLLLKWRRRQTMVDYDDGVYWCDLRKRPRRNLVVYDGRPNRHTGEVDGCVHVELRFNRADAVRRQGILCIHDLLTANLGWIVAKHIKLSSYGDWYVSKTIRSAIKDDIDQHRNRQVSPFMDRYRSTIAVRVRSILQKAGFDRAQMVKQEYRLRRERALKSLGFLKMDAVVGS